VPKLYGFTWRQGNGVIIDAKELIVTDGPGMSIPLRNHTQRAVLQVLLTNDEPRREQDPLPFMDHVNILFMEEGNVLVSRLMGPTLECVSLLPTRPWRRLRHDGRARHMKPTQQVSCAMW
jgi:phage portal protein BeeE